MAEIEKLTDAEREDIRLLRVSMNMESRAAHGAKALRIIGAQAARITDLEGALREIQKINRDGFKAPEVMAQLIAELAERALAGKGL